MNDIQTDRFRVVLFAFCSGVCIGYSIQHLDIPMFFIGSVIFWDAFMIVKKLCL